MPKVTRKAVKPGKGKGATGKSAKGKAPKGTRIRLRKVGMRNPNAVAELLLGRRIDWKAKIRPRGGMKATLEKAFEMDFKDIFDPASGSPLYAKSLSAAIRRRKM